MPLTCSYWARDLVLMGGGSDAVLQLFLALLLNITLSCNVGKLACLVGVCKKCRRTPAVVLPVSQAARADFQMLTMIGVVLFLLFVILCISRGEMLKKKPRDLTGKNSPPVQQQKPINKWNWRKRFLRKRGDVSENDVQLVATVLSAGLLDADPTSLQQLKEYRDLRGSHT